MQPENVAGKSRHLVRYDYGIGGLLWWIRAHSPEEIVLTLAGAEVVTDPEELVLAAHQELSEIDLDGELPAPLSGMKAERIEQSGQPGFGALVGRKVVHLGWATELRSGTTRSFVELGPDGRRIRMVEIGADDVAVRTSLDDWTSNSPYDLYDPQFAAMEIEAPAFEKEWDAAAD